MASKFNELTKKALERAAKEIKSWQEQAPHEYFIKQAMAAGFTDLQAEFLWSSQPRPEWKF